MIGMHQYSADDNLRPEPQYTRTIEIYFWSVQFMTRIFDHDNTGYAT
jgi:hypothetical protein